jgi:TP901 family phage tail tape measure protein
MPLGVREVLLIVRAQNMSSGVLRSISGDFNNLEKDAKSAAQQAMQTGTAMMAVGAGIAAVGAAGVAFLSKAASEAVNYNAQVALTKTQMFGVKASFDQVAQAGLDVASKIAVPLDQIQGGLYDIFSSMDVNLSQAKFLLTNFSKEAVAGQVDLSTAERASIGILNAYQLKVSDVSKVQDIMFNLVKYGVGTYADFANAIGRVTGPAVRANQTFEQTAALMAFTTRNGLSASNAASSVGRALDAIGKSRDKIKDFGQIVVNTLGPATSAKLGITAKSMIKMTDAGGKLLPINQIMTEMGTALKGLNPTQLNDVLTEMFKNTGGTIQAMRFIDIAVKNYGQLNTITKEMANSKGALQAAYNTMANTPAMQIQLLKNNFHVLMIEIGDALLPVLNKLVIGLKDLFMWVGKIPHPVILIGTAVLAVISILLILTGIVVAAAGAWLILTTIIAASEIAFTPILVVAGLVIAAIIALAVAAFFIVKYWGPISTWFHNMWFDMWHWIDHIWTMIWTSIKDAWNKVKQVFLSIQSFITGSFDKWWVTHGKSIEDVWHAVWLVVGGDLKSAWAILNGILKVAMGIFGTALKIELDAWILAFKVAWSFIETLFKVTMSVLEGAFKIWLVALETVAKITWAAIQLIFKVVWDVLVALFSVFLDLMTGHWHQALVDIETLGKQVWNAIRAFLNTSWNAIVAGAKSIGSIFAQTWINVWHDVYNGARGVWASILSFLKSVWGDIESGARSTVSGVKNIWAGIESAFKVPIDWVIQFAYNDGIRALWNAVMGALGLGKFDLPAVKTLAAGGKLGGFGGGDIVPALLEPGETVVDKVRSRKYAWMFSMMGVPGYATGGSIPGPGIGRGGALGAGNPTGGPNILGSAVAVAKLVAAAATGNSVAFVNALTSISGSSGAGGQLAAMMATLPVAMMKKAITAIWHSLTSAAKQNGAPGTFSSANLVNVAKYMATHGYTPVAAAGIAAAVYGESGGNPEAAGTGGRGLIGWTPPGTLPNSAFTGNVVADFNNQLAAILRYNQIWRQFIPLLNGAADPISAADIYSQYFERPAVKDSDIHLGGPGDPRTIFAQAFDRGGYLYPGYTLAYNGTGKPEKVSKGEGTTQNIYITTNEINPRMHAAQLGFELARRSG